MPSDISIIIPVYNAEKTIKKAIISVLHQSIKNKQIIVIDDGSTDKTPNIVRLLLSNKPNCFVIKQMNRGAGIARNIGISRSTCKYITFLDADDTYPNKYSLEQMVKFADEEKLKICGGFRRDKYKIMTRKNPLHRDYCDKTSGPVIKKYIDYQYDYDYTSYIFERDLIISKKITFPNYRRFQDPPFFIRAMFESKKFGVVPIEAYQYKCIPNNKKRWSCEMVNDLIRGLTEVLMFSSDNSLAIMHNTTLQRFNYEYYDIITNSITTGNNTATKLINLANSKINSELISELPSHENGIKIYQNGRD